MKERRREWVLILIAGLVTAGIMFLLLLSQGYAPFGNNTLAWRDADIQYLDFYAYYKDVLEGHNNLSYSFSKTLGGDECCRVQLLSGVSLLFAGTIV